MLSKQEEDVYKDTDQPTSYLEDGTSTGGGWHQQPEGGYAYTEMQVKQSIAFQQQQQQASLQGKSYTISPVPKPMLNGAGHLVDHNFTYHRELQVSRIIKRAKNGYFYSISVDSQEQVFYRVWRGGLIPYLFYKACKLLPWLPSKRDLQGNMETWSSVQKGAHLAATLGAAYDAVDQDILDDIESRSHDNHIMDMLKTPPDNLKMIGRLDLLDGPPMDSNPHKANVRGNAIFAAQSNIRITKDQKELLESLQYVREQNKDKGETNNG